MNDWQREHRKKALEEQNDRLIILLVGLALIVLASIVHIPRAHAQDHQHEVNGTFGVHTHNGEIGKLYERWQRPNYRRDSEDDNTKNERYWGCCSTKDCHPVQTKMEGGHWFFMSYHPKYLSQWRQVPDELVETNYEDAELTPDGRAHACEKFLTGYEDDGAILCFTPGDPEQ